MFAIAPRTGTTFAGGSRLEVQMHTLGQGHVRSVSEILAQRVLQVATSTESNHPRFVVTSHGNATRGMRASILGSMLHLNPWLAGKVLPPYHASVMSVAELLAGDHTSPCLHWRVDMVVPQNGLVRLVPVDVHGADVAAGSSLDLHTGHIVPHATATLCVLWRLGGH